MEYKGYKIESEPPFNMKVIKPLSKGSVSKELRGSFTRTTDAQKVIDRFLDFKEHVNGKDSISSGDKPV